MKSAAELTTYLIDTQVLTTPNIIDAFKMVDRRHFVPDDYKPHAYLDSPLPIGYEQTISQPSTVAFMLELLKPLIGDQVMDIGSGSGWTTALLAKAIEPDGFVLGIERIDQLVKYGKNNLRNAGIQNADIRKATKEVGVRNSKFNKILVSATTEKLPLSLLDQLKNSGRLVIPVKDSIYLITKDHNIEVTEFPGFAFVPLIQEATSR